MCSLSTLPDVRRSHETGSPFDALRQYRPDGTEFWSGRDLCPLMGYGRWERFADAIDRAKIAARNTGMDVTSHFRASAKMVARSQGGGTPQEDVQLTRQAAYLVAMNGDPRKREIADAQAYFVVRTMQAEVAVPVQPTMSSIDVLRHALDRIEEAQQEAANATLLARTVTARVDAIEGHYDEFAALGYAKLHKLRTDRPYLIRLGKAATAAMRTEGQEPRKRQDATFGQINVYPTWALDEALLQLEGNA